MPLLCVHAQVSNLFPLRGDRLPDAQHRTARTQACQTWAKVTSLAAQA